MFERGEFYFLKDSFQVAPDFVIGKADDAQPTKTQAVFPLSIRRRLSVMNRTINLYDKCCGNAEKVYYESINDLLPPEVEAGELPAPQTLP